MWPLRTQYAGSELLDCGIRRGASRGHRISPAVEHRSHYERVGGAPDGARRERELVELRCGLIPRWAKDTKIGYSLINARADTVAEKPTFRSAFKKRRCLVLAEGYYEGLRDGKTKLPHLYEFDGLCDHVVVARGSRDALGMLPL